jgi:hypothetical protein
MRGYGLWRSTWGCREAPARRAESVLLLALVGRAAVRHVDNCVKKVMLTTASAANSRARASGGVVTGTVACQMKAGLATFTPKAVILSRIVLSTEDTFSDADAAKFPPAYWDTAAEMEDKGFVRVHSGCLSADLVGEETTRMYLFLVDQIESKSISSNANSPMPTSGGAVLSRAVAAPATECALPPPADSAFQVQALLGKHAARRRRPVRLKDRTGCGRRGLTTRAMRNFLTVKVEEALAKVNRCQQEWSHAHF